MNSTFWLPCAAAVSCVLRVQPATAFLSFDAGPAALVLSFLAKLGLGAKCGGQLSSSLGMTMDLDHVINEPNSVLMDVCTVYIFSHMIPSI